MEEFVETTEAEQTSDAFLDGWNDVDAPETEADQPVVEETAEEAQEPARESADEQTDAPADVDTTEENVAPEASEEPVAQVPEKPKTWTLKHMDDPERVVNEAELLTLANKGTDYDRIRGLYEQARPIMQIWEAAAKQHDMTVEEYTAMVRRSQIEAEGATPELAGRILEMENRQFAADKPNDPYYPPMQYQEPAKQEDRSAQEIREFTRNYPNVDGKSIPQEVWDAVIRNGVNLTAAYTQYVQKQNQAQQAELAQKAETAKQMQANASRTTGSMQSAGTPQKPKDPFLEGFDD